jgi:hypothetical protein
MSTIRTASIRGLEGRNRIELVFRRLTARQKAFSAAIRMVWSIGSASIDSSIYLPTPLMMESADLLVPATSMLCCNWPCASPQRPQERQT